MSSTPTPDAQQQQQQQQQLRSVDEGDSWTTAKATDSIKNTQPITSPTGHKKATGSIQIPPSRAHALAMANAAAAAAAASGVPAPTAAPAAAAPSSSSRRTPGQPRNKLHGSSRRFEQDYAILPNCLLGSGASGSVYVCTSRRNPSHEYAVKRIDKSTNSLDEDLFHEEIRILSTVRHRNIIRLKDVYETDNDIHIVTEL